MKKNEKDIHALEVLKNKHAEFQRRIDNLQKSPTPCHIALSELKREKLAIKDQIAKLSSEKIEPVLKDREQKDEPQGSASLEEKPVKVVGFITSGIIPKAMRMH